MSQSLNQLKRYLVDFPSGLYRADAQEAIASLEELLAGHELEIGDFYVVTEEVRGARQHFRKASAFTETESGREARERLEQMPPDPPLEDPEIDE